MTAAPAGGGSETDEDDDILGPAAAEAERQVELAPDALGGRIDRALAEALPELSRARIQALIAAGQVSRGGSAVTDASGRAQPGVYTVRIPPPEPATPRPEAIPLSILFEDAHLVVIDKPAGLPVHPGPGHPSGTLVNALLAHCGAALAGVGGVARPGIVHRLDMDTSGVMVVAKTDAAHRGLAELFARHDIERAYIALTRGAPRPASGVIETRIARSPKDRKKMAVTASGGRLAITRYALEAAYGPADDPGAARVRCVLETGRTHQIRVHLASRGAPVLGDPLYGSAPAKAWVREAIAASGLSRQALHAATLGFRHPVTGASLRFETPLPTDMSDLSERLKQSNT